MPALSSRLLALTAATAAAGAARTALRRASPGLDTTELTGATAVVTGGGSGIGRSLVLLLAQRGARVHVVDRDLPRAEAVVAQVQAAGGAAVAHAVDVSDPDAVAALADAVFAEGRLDLLFNNAGIGHAGAVVDTTLADWRGLVDVNLMGVVHGLHAFLPRLVAQPGRAAVVNTASMAGLFPSPGLAPYSATKAAVVGLSEAVDREVVGDGVRVHALCPGVIATDIIRTATMRGRGSRSRPASSRCTRAGGPRPTSSRGRRSTPCRGGGASSPPRATRWCRPGWSSAPRPVRAPRWRARSPGWSAGSGHPPR
jgi:NAD(P)-dependent dehydrogenase (short-subunit alcohol dehydrogenase family)